MGFILRLFHGTVMAGESGSEVNVGSPASEILRRWWLLLIFGLIGAAIAYFITESREPVWRAKSVLLLPIPGNRNVTLLGGPQGSPLFMVRGMLNSRTTFQYIEQTTRLEPGDIQIETDVRPDENQVVVYSTHKRRKMALEVNIKALEALDRIRTDTEVQDGAGALQDLEQIVNERQKELEEAQAELLEFVKTMKSPPNPEQPYLPSDVVNRAREAEFELERVKKQIEVAQQVARNKAAIAFEAPTDVPSIEAVRVELQNLRLHLDRLMTDLGPLNPEVIKQKRIIEVTEEDLRDRIAAYVKAVESDIDPDLALLLAEREVLEFKVEYLNGLVQEAPAEAGKYAQLQSKVTAAEEVLRNVRLQFESEQINSGVDQITWAVLEDPYVEAEPVNKSVMRNGALGFFGGMVLGSLIALWIAAARKKRRKKVRPKKVELPPLEEDAGYNAPPRI